MQDAEQEYLSVIHFGCGLLVKMLNIDCDIFLTIFFLLGVVK
jgi:hypothetical protein